MSQSSVLNSRPAPARMPASPAAAKAPEAAVMRKALRGASYADGAAMLSPVQALSGGGSELPHRAAIESSYGVDLGAVQAYTGPDAKAACDALGAEAFASGNRVAFADPSPSLELAAHEAAHTVQQSAGVRLSSRVSRPGDALEVQADQAAARAASGQSAADLLPETPTVAGAPASDAPVQCYHSRQGGDGEYRVSDDDSLAVRQDSIYGSHSAFAQPGQIDASSKALEAATSVMRLEAGKSTMKLDKVWQLAEYDEEGNCLYFDLLLPERQAVARVAKGGHARWMVTNEEMADWDTPDKAPGFGTSTVTLTEVVPVNTKSQIGDPTSGYTEEETRGDDTMLWPDCGRAAVTVSGGDGGTGQGRGAMRAHTKDGEGNDQYATANDPAIQKSEIMLNKYRKELESNPVAWNRVRSTFHEWKQWDQAATKAWATSGTKEGKVVYENARKQATWAGQRYHDAVRAIYDALDPSDQDLVDKELGINKYADPKIGEAYHTSTHGGRHPELEEGKGTWNFHWGGVVMKGGGDNVTMEGYANGTQVQNSEWFFQMYGVGKDKEKQSFHEQHKDVHKQHGTKPMTMAMAPKREADKAQNK